MPSKYLKKKTSKSRLPRSSESGVWGGMSSHGVTPLHQVDGRLKSANYITVLQKTRLSAASKLFPSGHWTLLQDKSLVHTSRETQAWISQRMGAVMPAVRFPPCSPDLNLIENLWSVVQDKLGETKFTSVKGLWTVLRKTWNSVDPYIHTRTILSHFFLSRNKTIPPG